MVWFIFRAEYYHEALRPDVPTETSTADIQEKYRAWKIAISK